MTTLLPSVILVLSKGFQHNAKNPKIPLAAKSREAKDDNKPDSGNLRWDSGNFWNQMCVSHSDQLDFLFEHACRSLHPCMQVCRFVIVAARSIISFIAGFFCWNGCAACLLCCGWLGVF
jgi:hypothetical protein